MSDETVIVAQGVNWAQLTNPNEFHFQIGVTPFSSGVIPVVGVAFYLAMVYYLQKYMARRTPVDVSKVSQAHNLLLCLFSLLIFVAEVYEVVSRIAATGVNTLFCESADHGNPIRGRMYYWGYIFYLSKYYDFFDTVLLCLKKKPLQFIHVYHHAIVPLSVWGGIAGGVAMPVWTACLFNSAVHTVMYYYYFCLGQLEANARRAAKIESASPGGVVKRPRVDIWWKKYVTMFQLVQFQSGFVLSCMFLRLWIADFNFTNEGKTVGLQFRRGCSGNVWAVVFVFFVNISFLLLWVDLYYSKYLAARSARSAKAQKVE